MEFRKTIFQAWKVMENSEGYGKSWKMLIMSCNFYNCTEQVTQIMNRNVILFTQFALVYLLTNVQLFYCIHKSYIVYFEISVVPTGHGFSFFGHGKVIEKSRKISVGKEGAPWLFFSRENPMPFLS